MKELLCERKKGERDVRDAKRKIIPVLESKWC